MNGIAENKQIALDSNIFIYNLEGNPQFSSGSNLIFEKLVANKLKAVTSIISLTEILSYPKTLEVAEQITDDFFSTPNLTIFEVNKEIAVKAADLRRKYTIRLPDAIQIATAIYAKAQAFITNDKRLKKCKELDILLLSSL